MPADKPSTSALVPVAVRAERRGTYRRPLLGWVAVGIAVLVWQGLAIWQDDAIFLPGPVQVLEAAGRMASSGELVRHVSASLVRLAAGWLTGAGAGLLLGLAMALWPAVRAMLLPLVSALFALPKIALLPLFILWLGIGESAKIATIALGVMSPMAMAALGGFDGVDPRLLRMARSFGLSGRQVVTKILLPGALPALLTGVRVTAGIALVLLVAAEMLAAQYGIGGMALQAGSLMRTDRLFVALGLLAALGMGFSALVTMVERRLLFWL